MKCIKECIFRTDVQWLEQVSECVKQIATEYAVVNAKFGKHIQQG